jgi:hypothetical protein
MHRTWTIGTAAATAAGALMLAGGSAHAQYAVSQLPALTPAPPTNIVMTVDDSGSMQWAYVPDSMGGNTGTRRFNAGSFNALAYNPNIVYPPPVMITSAAADKFVHRGADRRLQHGHRRGRPVHGVPADLQLLARFYQSELLSAP